jgi:hypothetical protein
MSRCISAFHLPKLPDGKIPAPYPHSSLCFTLEEFASLIRKHADDTINFLLQAYDCSSYSYECLKRGKDYIKNPCLSILAGTTFEFLSKVFGGNDALLGGGFASRVIFVVAKEPRFKSAFLPPMTEDQRASIPIIANHIKKLTEIYGRVDFGKEALDWFDNWWCKEEEITRVNNSPKLKDYYARKNITIIKLAMVLHFSESTELTIPNGKEMIQKAIDILAGIEKEMHTVLSFDTKNPIARLTKDIATSLARNGGYSENDIIIDFFGDAPEGVKSIKQALEFLVSAKKIRYNGETKKYEAILK